jgi:two-component system sensor histidine kinase QseC
MYSIRRRLTGVLLGGLLLVLVGAGFWVREAVAGHLLGEFDAALLSRVRALAALTENEAGRIELDYEPDRMPEFEREDDPAWFQFWLDDGRVLLRSRHLREDLPLDGIRSEKARIFEVTLAGGVSARAALVYFLPGRTVDLGDEGDAIPAPMFPPAQEERGVFLAVARSRRDLDALVGRVDLTVLLAGVGAALLATLLVWRALLAAFRPIDAIARRVEELDAERLGERIDAPTRARELAPVVRQFNDLLARLDGAFARERRFTGNVAHELRTPIAELRSLASVATLWPQEEEARRRFFSDVKDIAGRMDALVADLLLLARCQGGAESARRVPVPLRDALLAAWKRLAERAAARRMRLELHASDVLVIESDPQKLSIVLGNLLANAVEHGLAGSSVRCVAEAQGSRFSLEVSNAGPPLTQEQMERLTEPFWRGEESRAAPEHAGLGLALVGALAPLLDLTVRFDQPQAGLFRVTLEGPVSEQAPQPEPEPAFA